MTPEEIKSYYTENYSLIGERVVDVHNYEGKGYADYLNSIGMDAFVLEYRVSPNRFPLPLNDARRAIRFVRYHAEKFGIDRNRIAIMPNTTHRISAIARK
jgi:hypothetical protein